MDTNQVNKLSFIIDVDGFINSIGQVCVNSQARLIYLKEYFSLQDYVNDWIEENDAADFEFQTTNNTQISNSISSENFNQTQITLIIDLKKSFKTISLVQTPDYYKYKIKREQDYFSLKHYQEKWQHCQKGVMTQCSYSLFLKDKFDSVDLSIIDTNLNLSNISMNNTNLVNQSNVSQSTINKALGELSKLDGNNQNFGLESFCQNNELEYDIENKAFEENCEKNLKNDQNFVIKSIGEEIKGILEENSIINEFENINPNLEKKNIKLQKNNENVKKNTKNQCNKILTEKNQKKEKKYPESDEFLFKGTMNNLVDNNLSNIDNSLIKKVVKKINIDSEKSFETFLEQFPIDINTYEEHTSEKENSLNIEKNSQTEQEDQKSQSINEKIEISDKSDKKTAEKSNKNDSGTENPQENENPLSNSDSLLSIENILEDDQESTKSGDTQELLEICENDLNFEKLIQPKQQDLDFYKNEQNCHQLNSQYTFYGKFFPII